MKKKVLLIIPAYNEEKNILNTVTKIDSFNKKMKTNYDYVVINDGSTDSTEDILVKNNINHISLIHNLGIGGAVQTGYKYAYENEYDVAIQFDGDGQHNVEYVKNLLQYMEKNKYDMVIGSRYVESNSKNEGEFKSTALRRFGIKIISLVIKLFTGKKITDTTSGFRACNKRVIEYFSHEYPLEYPEPISTTILIKKGYNIGECHVEMNAREGGVSSIRAWKTVYYMFNVILSIVVTCFRRYRN